MDAIQAMYEEIILKHHKTPYHYGPLAQRSHRWEGRNPRCGDEVHLQVSMNEERIEQVYFQGQACAIVRASASLLAHSMEGKTREQARLLIQRVLSALAGETELIRNRDGELAALTGVRQFPARIACARLPWQTLWDGLRQPDLDLID